MTKKDQADRFKEAARQLECDDDEAHFDAKLKKVAKAKSKDDEKSKDTSSNAKLRNT